MAKLNKKMQGEVEKAQAGFTPMPDGTYHFRLRDVDSTRTGNKGPYWSWEYECVEEPHVGRRQWNNTSLSEESLGFMKATFQAFDASLDTDTDELIGKIVRLQLTTRTIQPPSPRAGEQTNNVNRVLKPDPDFQLPESAAVTASAGAGSGQAAADDVIF
jgi:hypothetical protein